MDQKSQWQCASTSSKIETLRAVMKDQAKLLTILKSLNIIEGSQNEIRHNQLEAIISTMRTPGAASTPSTRASKKKARTHPLLPDIGDKKKSSIGMRKVIIATKAKQQEVKAHNTTKHWVVDEGDDYLAPTEHSE